MPPFAKGTRSTIGHGQNTSFKRVLGDKSASRYDRIESLKFIVHFVGDIHQPFHAIGEAKGGNGVHITEFGSNRCGRYPCNLHSAWDSGLIEHAGMDEEAYVAHLEQLITREHLHASGNPADWANESFALAKAAWVNDGGSVDEQYYRQQIKVVDERLALAGLRLAAIQKGSGARLAAGVSALILSARWCGIVPIEPTKSGNRDAFCAPALTPPRRGSDAIPQGRCPHARSALELIATTCDCRPEVSP